jgi:hypothetical protein
MCCDPTRCDGALVCTVAAHFPSRFCFVLIPIFEFETPAGRVRKAVPLGFAVASSNCKFLDASQLASDAQPGRSVAI